MLLIVLYTLLTATTIMVRVEDSAFGNWGARGVKLYPSALFRFCLVAAIVVIFHGCHSKSGLHE